MKHAPAFVLAIVALTNNVAAQTTGIYESTADDRKYDIRVSDTRMDVYTDGQLSAVLDRKTARDKFKGTTQKLAAQCPDNSGKVEVVSAEADRIRMRIERAAANINGEKKCHLLFGSDWAEFNLVKATAPAALSSVASTSPDSAKDPGETIVLLARNVAVDSVDTVLNDIRASRRLVPSSEALQSVHEVPRGRHAVLWIDQSADTTLRAAAPNQASSGGVAPRHVPGNDYEFHTLNSGAHMLGFVNDTDLARVISAGRERRATTGIEFKSRVTGDYVHLLSLPWSCVKGIERPRVEFGAAQRATSTMALQLCPAAFLEVAGVAADPTPLRDSAVQVLERDISATNAGTVLESRLGSAGAGRMLRSAVLLNDLPAGYHAVLDGRSIRDDASGTDILRQPTATDSNAVAIPVHFVRGTDGAVRLLGFVNDLELPKLSQRGATITMFRPDRTVMSAGAYALVSIPVDYITTWRTMSGVRTVNGLLSNRTQIVLTLR